MRFCDPCVDSKNVAKAGLLAKKARFLALYEWEQCGYISRVRMSAWVSGQALGVSRLNWCSY